METHRHAVFGCMKIHMGTGLGGEPIENGELLQDKKEYFSPHQGEHQAALQQVSGLRSHFGYKDSYLEDFKYHLGHMMTSRIKEVKTPKNYVIDEGSQTPCQSAPRSIPDTRKRLRDTNVSPKATAVKKPEEKRSRT